MGEEEKPGRKPPTIGWFLKMGLLIYGSWLLGNLILGGGSLTRSGPVPTPPPEPPPPRQEAPFDGTTLTR